MYRAGRLKFQSSHSIPFNKNIHSPQIHIDNGFRLGTYEENYSIMV
jgi:hypothetical protein